jgi:spermidine/putrescine transport system ATP-binding protein
MADPIVRLRDVVKKHGPTTAVDHVSLDITRGEFFSILGPSGSGKTTLLRLLAGFDHPDQGDIVIDGSSMTDVPPQRRPVNMVFQHYALFPHLTVFRNVAFGLEMQREPPASIRARVGEALEMVRLSGMDARLPAELSGGEQQRVALARALVNRPKVLLLDEPLAALDQQLRREMQHELKAIQEQIGISFIGVTHHQEEALTMSDRLAVMSQGRILQVGTPRDLYEKPACAAVGTFVGLSNCLSGQVVSLNGSRCAIRLRTAPGAAPLLANRPADVAEGRAVTLMVRPERVQLLKAGPGGDGMNLLAGRIEKSSYAGTDLHYVVRLDGGALWKVRVANAASDVKLFTPGEGVCVGWQADDSIILSE